MSRVEVIHERYRKSRILTLTFACLQTGTGSDTCPVTALALKAYTLQVVLYKCLIMLHGNDCEVTKLSTLAKIRFTQPFELLLFDNDAVM